MWMVETRRIENASPSQKLPKISLFGRYKFL
jgi:hypothetical protein